MHQNRFSMRYVCLLLLFGNTLFATQGSPTDNTEGLIEVYFDEYENLVTDYTLQKDKTIYKAARLFHRTVELIMEYNDLTKSNEMAKGSQIRVPIDLAFVYRGVSTKGFKSTKFVPLVYTVKPKDNLFRIAKVYCDEDVKTMMKRNNLKSHSLKIGQKLVVGWIPIDAESRQYYSDHQQNIEEPTIGPTELPTVEPIATMVKEVESEESMLIPESTNDDGLLPEEIVEDDLTREKGIAIWTKTSKGHSRYALHPTARLNSEIELYNPLVNRTVTAKVIGRIPEGAYNNDVSVIISPATAVSLGALDGRFKVEMKYKL